MQELYAQRRVGFRFLDGAEDIFRKRQRVEHESEVVDKRYEIFCGAQDDMNRARQVLSPQFLVWLSTTRPRPSRSSAWPGCWSATSRATRSPRPSSTSSARAPRRSPSACARRRWSSRSRPAPSAATPAARRSGRGSPRGSSAGPTGRARGRRRAGSWARPARLPPRSAAGRLRAQRARLGLELARRGATRSGASAPGRGLSARSSGPPTRAGEARRSRSAWPRPQSRSATASASSAASGPLPSAASSRMTARRRPAGGRPHGEDVQRIGQRRHQAAWRSRAARSRSASGAQEARRRARIGVDDRPRGARAGPEPRCRGARQAGQVPAELGPQHGARAEPARHPGPLEPLAQAQRQRRLGDGPHPARRSTARQTGACRGLNASPRSAAAPMPAANASSTAHG